VPLYEYRCCQCGKVNEVLQRIGAAPLENCDFCRGKKLEKIVSQSSFVLKGTGWYVTDFRDKDKKKKEKVDSISKTETKNSPKKGPDKIKKVNT